MLTKREQKILAWMWAVAIAVLVTPGIVILLVGWWLALTG